MKNLLAVFLLVAIAPFANAQLTETQKIEYALRDAPKVLIYGRLISDTGDDMIISCAQAKHSHPTGVYGISDSQERLVHVRCSRAAFLKMAAAGSGLYPAVLNDPQKTVAFVAKEFGEFTYTTLTGVQNTVANFVLADALPMASVVTPFDPSKPETKIAAQRGSAQTPELTLKRNW